MFEEIKKKYYQKRILGYYFKVSESYSGWCFQTYYMISRKGKNIKIPYTKFIVDTYYEKEMEIENFKLLGYQLIEEESKEKVKSKIL